jgi:hypothetical protein
MKEYRKAGGWFAGDQNIAKICRPTLRRTEETIAPKWQKNSPLARGGKTVKTHAKLSADSLGLFDLFYGDSNGASA